MSSSLVYNLDSLVKKIKQMRQENENLKKELEKLKKTEAESSPRTDKKMKKRAEGENRPSLF